MKTERLTSSVLMISPVFPNDSAADACVTDGLTLDSSTRACDSSGTFSSVATLPQCVRCNQARGEKREGPRGAVRRQEHGGHLRAPLIAVDVAWEGEPVRHDERGVVLRRLKQQSERLILGLVLVPEMIP